MTAVYGLLGGTFDPVHIGHLRAAIEACERLGLTRIDLLPAADPPLKAPPRVSANQRLAMIQAAVSDIPGVGVDDRELAREGVSYTVDTLRSWRRDNGDDASLVFVVGEDILPSLPRWSRWAELLDLCHLAVLARPGASLSLPSEVLDWLRRNEESVAALPHRPAGSVVRVSQPPLAVSSTAIRSALAAGESVQYLLPDAVIEYIRTFNLYGASNAPRDSQ